jgi:hypothetical protein
MTETSKLRARYARMYALGILTLLAATVASAAVTVAPGQPAMDVSAIMISIDTSSLPIQGHVDAI